MRATTLLQKGGTRTGRQAQMSAVQGSTKDQIKASTSFPVQQMN